MTRPARLLAVLLLLAACGPAQATPDVVVTIRPLHSLTAMVMRGVGEPKLLLSSAASPHSYAMRPSGALALNRAKLVIWTGETMETFLARSLPGLGDDTTILTLAAVEGMDLLANRTGHGEEHSEESDDGHGLMDPHVWLSPRNAARMITAIALALEEVDPDNGLTYLQNAQDAVREVASLEAELAMQLADVKGRAYVAAHDAYQYFDTVFGIAYAGAVTAHPGRPPSARHVLALSDDIEERNVTCLLTEPGNRPPLIESLARDKGLKLVEADPLGLSETPGPGLYPAMMRQLAADFAECLTP